MRRRGRREREEGGEGERGGRERMGEEREGEKERERGWREEEGGRRGERESIPTNKQNPLTLFLSLAIFPVGVQENQQFRKLLSKQSDGVLDLTLQLSKPNGNCEKRFPHV